MGSKEQAALRRIIALLLALADLAEAACIRSRPVRWLVLLILGSGEAAARGYVADLTGIPESAWPIELAIDPDHGAPDDSVERALRLAFVFKTLAATLAALTDEAAGLASRPGSLETGLAAALAEFVPVLRVELRDSS